MILYAYRNGYSRSRIFQSEAHLKLKEILKNIIIESCFFLIFCSEFFFCCFFLFAREKQNRKLKNKKKRRYLRAGIRSNTFKALFISISSSWRTGHWRQGESTYWMCGDLLIHKTCHRIWILIFQLSALDNVLITSRFMHVEARCCDENFVFVEIQVLRHH